jgi:hypothetical protein
MGLRVEDKQSGLKVPDKNIPEKNQSGLKVPDKKPWVVIQEKNGIKLVKNEEDPERKYMIIGGCRVYSYRSITWAKKSHERMVDINENLQY